MFYYLKKFHGRNMVTAVFILMTSAFQAANSLVLVQMLQEFIDLDFNGFVVWSLIFVAVYLFAIWFGYAAAFFKARAIRAMNNDVRQDLAATLSQKEYSEFHNVAAGEYLSWFTNDINQIETLAWRPFFGCIELGSLAVFSGIALVIIHWLLLVAALLTVLIMLTVPQLFNKRMESLRHMCTQEQAKATDGLKDLLLGYDILRSFGQIRRFFEGTKTSSDRIEIQRFRLDYIKNAVDSGMSCVNLVCQISLDVLIAFLSLKGIIPKGSLFGGVNLCGQLANATGGLANSLVSFAASKPYFDKIAVRIKDIKSDEEAMAQPFSHSIVFDNVSFDYTGDNTRDNALSSLSLHFDEGGKYALVGPSGTGKTTVLKLLLGWLPNYRGFITFDGVDARTYTPDQIQKEISYIGQDVFLFNTTIRDNITLGEDFSEEQLQKAIKDSALEADLSAMPEGLDTVVGEGGSSISGGQKQRVAIARALIHSRSILLVNEGTSALDRKNADIIEDTLLANNDLTLTMISHHLSPERKEKFTRIYDLQRMYKKDDLPYACGKDQTVRRSKDVHHNDDMTPTC